MEFRENQAICIQIAEYVCEQILLKKRNLGEKILSIRELAVLMQVTPNTVQRAYDFLQQGYNTNIGLFKLKQKSISVNLSGKSKFEVESYLSDLDTLTVSQKDSSEVVFEMSPDLATANSLSVNTNKPNDQAMIKAEKSDVMLTPAPFRKGWETMNVQFVNASIKDVSLLDVGHAQIKSLQLDIADSSAIILAGGTLKTIRK